MLNSARKVSYARRCNRFKIVFYMYLVVLLLPGHLRQCHMADELAPHSSSGASIPPTSDINQSLSHEIASCYIQANLVITITIISSVSISTRIRNTGAGPTCEERDGSYK